MLRIGYAHNSERVMGSTSDQGGAHPPQSKNKTGM
jgi:hypothetical protein